MKEINVSKLELPDDYPGLDLISEKLEYKYKPEVSFAMAYSDKEIFLKYYVTENYIMAEKSQTNEMVCEDSCVEFFVSPGGDGIYYNMEFNPIGTCLLGTGTARENSTRANPDIISSIRRLPSLGSRPFGEKTGDFQWTLTLAIPFKVFFHHKIENLQGRTFRANFYKCGDKLTVPHYVTWNPVGTGDPDYHQPAYFGLLRFI